MKLRCSYALDGQIAPRRHKAIVLPWPGWRLLTLPVYSSVETVLQCARPDRSLRGPWPATGRLRGRSGRTSRPSSRTQLVLQVAYAIAVIVKGVAVQNVSGLARCAGGRGGKRNDLKSVKTTRGKRYIKSVNLVFAVVFAPRERA